MGLHELKKMNLKRKISLTEMEIKGKASLLKLELMNKYHEIQTLMELRKKELKSGKRKILNKLRKTQNLILGMMITLNQNSNL